MQCTVSGTMTKCPFKRGVCIRTMQRLCITSVDTTDVIQLTLSLKMTTAQVVETSVTVNNNSPIQDYVHPDDQTQPTFEMTPGFKLFTMQCLYVYGTMTKCPVKRGLHLRKVNNVVFVCVWDQEEVAA